MHSAKFIWTATAFIILSFTTLFLSCGSKNEAADDSLQQNVKIAAFDNGAYKTFTSDAWKQLPAKQRDSMHTVGIEVTYKDQKFIVAPTDAASGANIKWEDKVTDVECENIPALQDLNTNEEVDFAKALQDFSGLDNTLVIQQYAGESGSKFPAVEASVNYNDKGHNLSWYLPSTGQLSAMYKNKEQINKALKAINGKNILNAVYWSSSENNSTDACVVGMFSGTITENSKTDLFRVRAVANLPQ